MPEEVNEDASKDDKTVPLAALTAETGKRQALEATVAELRGRVEGMATVSKQTAAPEPKPWTRATLRTAVEDEKITQDEADALFDTQTEKRLTATLEAKLETRLASQTVGARVETQIGQYKDAIPDLGDKDSANFAKVTAEFKALADLGYDKTDLRTEVAALRAAFGDVGTLSDQGNTGTRRVFEEAGGQGDGPKGGDDGVDGYPKGTSTAQRRFHDDLISKGIETKKDAIRQLNYTPKTGRAGKAA